MQDCHDWDCRSRDKNHSPITGYSDAFTGETPLSYEQHVSEVRGWTQMDNHFFVVPCNENCRSGESLSFRCATTPRTSGLLCYWNLMVVNASEDLWRFLERLTHNFHHSPISQISQIPLLGLAVQLLLSSGAGLLARLDDMLGYI